MKGISRILFGSAIMAVLPYVAGAAGTYYNGNLYQNPQSKYATNAGGFYNNYGAGRGYGQNMQGVGVTKTTIQTTKKTKTTKTTSSKKQGFQLGIDLNHEFADWDVQMNTAGSNLHYDNLRWNVLSGDAAYYFGDSFPMQIKVGGRYGLQFGESSMVDDDITAGNMWTTQDMIVGGNTEQVLIGTPALSVGTSKGGKQYGFNAAFGFTDLFDTGRVKMTPSIGYRYFKHILETKSNYGLMVQVLNSDSFVNCVEVQNGEIQCSPYIGFANSSNQILSYAGLTAVVDSDGSILGYIVENDKSADLLDVGETYYYEQSGTSHKYETVWAGPYIALDMEYTINDNNIVNAGLEFGLPTYDSKGDQPYRFDWEHPTSVEDKGDFGDAYHFGFNAMWSTSISDSMMLSLGMTYDYYHVGDATATTYFNKTYNQALLTAYETNYNNGVGLTETEYETMLYLQELKSSDWKLKSDKEIESVYKSMGIRLGLTARF